ncbi:MAG: membrane protein insertase YidC [Deltaproteobacteria bacterium]|nr:membrane protein insertase YidC [Deltaproteobacteria bacterium]
MEKRTLLAFALSFLILVLWSAFYSPTGKRAPSTGDQAPAVEEQRPAVEPAPLRTGQESLSAPQPQPAGPPPAAKPVPEQEVRVETPLYSATWSNVDGLLESFKLKNYRTAANPNAPRVDLVNLADSRDGLLAFRFTREGVEPALPVLYEFSSARLEVTPESGARTLVMTGQSSNGLVLEHTYRFYPDRYRIDVKTRTVNRGELPVEGALSARMRNLPPSDQKSYYGFVGVALLLNGELEEIKPKKMKDEEKRLSGSISWIAYEDDYFMASVLPSTPSEGRFRGKTLPSGVLEADYLASPVRLGPQEQMSADFSLYLGPRDVKILSAVGNDLDKAVDFGWTDIIAKPLLQALRFFNGYVHNYGFAILILTVLIKILFWPLTHKSYKSMKEMQKIQPLMAKLREKHKDNKEQMNRELMQLYKTYKVNPMGGCLPMVIQIPVFLALFRVLSSSIELRHAPFIFWINDLSAPDRLFTFPFQIPFMAPPSGIPVLTLLMGASMFLQQKMSPSPGDPTQAKIMMFLPLIFTFVFINFPSGLVLYWLTNNILSIGQQYRILKKSA